MRVLLIPSGHPARGPMAGGSYSAEQAEIVRRVLGWECDILAPRIFSAKQAGRQPDNPQVGAAPDVEKLPDGGEVWRGAFSYRFPQSRVSAWRKFGGEMFSAYAEQRGTPDLIWSQCLTRAGWLASDLRRRFGVPYFLHEHSSRYFPPERVSFVRRPGLRRTARGGVYCAAVGGAHRRAVARQLRVAEGEWEVVHNPVGFLFSQSAPRPPRSGRFVFVSVGQLTARKNPAAIVRAFARIVREEDSEARLRLIGGGEEREALAKLIAELGLEDSAELAGVTPRPAVRDAMLSADALLLPSDAEACSLVLLEAMACGLPCVATPAGIAGEIVDDETGALIPDATPEAIFAGMKKVRRGTYDSGFIRDRAMKLSSPERFCETIRGLLESRGFSF